MCLSKAIGFFVSALPFNGKCECSVHIFRGPWLITRGKPRTSLEMDRTLDFDCIHLRILDPNVAKFPCSYINCLYVILTALQYKPQFTSPFLQRSLVKLKLKRNILTMWSGLSRIWSLDSDQFQPNQLKQLFCTIDYP